MKQWQRAFLFVSGRGVDSLALEQRVESHVLAGAGKLPSTASAVSSS